MKHPYNKVSCKGECPICYEEFLPTERIIQLIGCNHLYHYECLEELIEHNNTTCPLCRHPIYQNV